MLNITTKLNIQAFVCTEIILILTRHSKFKDYIIGPNVTIRAMCFKIISRAFVFTSFFLHPSLFHQFVGFMLVNEGLVIRQKRVIMFYERTKYSYDFRCRAVTRRNMDLKIDVYGKPLAATANFKSYFDFNSLVYEFRTIYTVFYIEIEALAAYCNCRKRVEINFKI